MQVSKEVKPSDFLLEIIPIIIHNGTKKVCVRGQAFPTKECKIVLYTAVSYLNKAWYSDIDHEEPLTEMELYQKGRLNAVLGYNMGEYTLNLKTMKFKVRNIYISEFLKYRSISSPLSLTPPLPSLLYEDNKGDEYVTTKCIKRLNNLKAPPIAYGIKSIVSWGGNLNKFKYKRELDKKGTWVGIQGIKSKNDIYVDDIFNTPGFQLPRLTFPWNHKNPFQALNSELNAWLHNL